MKISLPYEKLACFALGSMLTTLFIVDHAHHPLARQAPLPAIYASGIGIGP